MSHLGSSNTGASMRPSQDEGRHIEPGESAIPSTMEDKRKLPWLVWLLVAVAVIAALAIVESVVGTTPRPVEQSPQEVGPTRDDPARRTQP